MSIRQLELRVIFMDALLRTISGQGPDRPPVG